MEPWIRVFVLMVGGGLGANARYWLGVGMNRWAAAHWATFTINVSGSFAIGFLAMALTRWLPHPNVRLLVLTGFLGGYTTFSTFAFESVTLWERGERGLSLANMAGSVAAGFVAALLGIALARDILIPAWERHPLPEPPAQARPVGPSPEARRLAEQDVGSPDLELPPGAAAVGLGEPPGGRAEEAS